MHRQAHKFCPAAHCKNKRRRARNLWSFPRTLYSYARVWLHRTICLITCYMCFEISSHYSAVTTMCRHTGYWVLTRTCVDHEFEMTSVAQFCSCALIGNCRTHPQNVFV